MPSTSSTPHAPDTVTVRAPNSLAALIEQSCDEMGRQADSAYGEPSPGTRYGAALGYIDVLCAELAVHAPQRLRALTATVAIGLSVTITGCGGGADDDHRVPAETRQYSQQIAGPLSTGYAGRVASFSVTPEITGAAEVTVSYTIAGMRSADSGWVGAWLGRSFDTVAAYHQDDARMTASIDPVRYTASASFPATAGQALTLKLFAGASGETTVTDVQWSMTVTAE